MTEDALGSDEKQSNVRKTRGIRLSAQVVSCSDLQLDK